MRRGARPGWIALYNHSVNPAGTRQGESDEQIEVIANFGDLCGEGPRWNSREQALYWTDLLRPRLYRCGWAERKPEILSQRFQVSGFVFNEAGGLVVTNVTGIWLWDLQSEPALIAREQDGHTCIMNDCIADPEGRVFSGSYFRNPSTGNFDRVGYLFCVDNDGSVSIVDEGFRLSNGLGFSLDHRTFYFVDSADRVIYAYDRRLTDGALSNRRVLVHVPATEGIPDGLTVDAEGYLWCAHWFGGCLIRYDPEGAVERRIEMPAAQVSSVAFGGPDLEDLFVTSAAKTDSLNIAPPGYDPNRMFTGGPVYRFKPGVQGRDQFFARIVKG